MRDPPAGYHTKTIRRAKGTRGTPTLLASSAAIEKKSSDRLRCTRRRHSSLLRDLQKAKSVRKMGLLFFRRGDVYRDATPGFDLQGVAARNLDLLEDDAFPPPPADDW